MGERDEGSDQTREIMRGEWRTGKGSGGGAASQESRK